MKSDKGIILGVIAAAGAAGMVCAFNSKALKNGKKKAIKWMSKTARSMGGLLQDFSYSLK